uniref:Uncharacterized protein n=1 Tax=Aegilops tauschii subsp. strangulata TaxID=200361 RepID=A0A453KUP9_AEGTS
MPLGQRKEDLLIKDTNFCSQSWRPSFSEPWTREAGQVDAALPPHPVNQKPLIGRARPNQTNATQTTPKAPCRFPPPINLCLWSRPTRSHSHLQT